MPHLWVLSPQPHLVLLALLLHLAAPCTRRTVPSPFAPAGHPSHSAAWSQVVERALRTAACLLAGSACDAAWETYAGDAVDGALEASNKARAGAFAAAASAAAGAVLEALMARNGQLHSNSLLGALCLAHSQAVLSPECLAALCPGSSRGRTLSPVVEVGEHERAGLGPCQVRACLGLLPSRVWEESSLHAGSQAHAACLF